MPIENRNLNQGNQTNRPVSQTDLLLRSSGGRRRETALQAGRWPGIQEPIGCRNGHHRAFLRRLEILECGNGGECGCTGCGERPCSVDGTHSKCRAGCRARNDCRQDRHQENRGLSGAESEGCAGRTDSLVLPGLRQELYGLGSRSTGRLSQPPSQLKLREMGISNSSQAPLIGSLPCFALLKVTMPPLSAEVTNGDKNSLLRPATRGDIW